MKYLNLIYGFQIGIILKKREFEIIIENELFKKSFIFVGFSEDYVHFNYLPKKIEDRGPMKGSVPGRVT